MGQITENYTGASMYMNHLYVGKDAVEEAEELLKEIGCTERVSSNKRVYSKSVRIWAAIALVIMLIGVAVSIFTGI